MDRPTGHAMHLGGRRGRTYEADAALRRGQEPGQCSTGWITHAVDDAQGPPRGRQRGQAWRWTPTPLALRLSVRLSGPGKGPEEAGGVPA
eukprot:3052629-Heterocapsa_arctica.AAC.1